MSAEAKSDGGQPPLEPPKGNPTNYMVLWAPVPDEGDPLKWRELGWYEAHSAESAKVKGRDDKESGAYGQMLDIAGPTGRGFVMRAIAERSWPTEPGEVFVQETAWSTKPYAAKEES